eukprot:s8200_g3.t1
MAAAMVLLPSGLRSFKYRGHKEPTESVQNGSVMRVYSADGEVQQARCFCVVVRERNCSGCIRFSVGMLMGRQFHVMVIINVINMYIVVIATAVIRSRKSFVTGKCTAAASLVMGSPLLQSSQCRKQQ